MAKLIIKKGTTSHICHVFIQDSSAGSGAGLTGLVFGDITGYWTRPKDATATAITLATISTLGTWETGGFKEYDATNLPGVYELHLPNAALASASGKDQVIVMLKGGTNMVPLLLEIQLTDFDLNDASPDVNVVEWRASTPGLLTAAGNLPSNVKQWLGLTPNVLASGAVDADVSAMQANSITAAAIADNSIDAATYAADTNIYHADIRVTVDTNNDEYTITWFKNGVRITSGITSPTIQVIKRADGTDLVASTAMTQIGSTGSYRYNESSDRMTAGESAIAVVVATIDSGSRTFSAVLSRDV